MSVSNTITIDNALKLKSPIFVDVRSPGEFSGFYIPGALNMPLLNDQQRHEIGIIHNNEGPVKARRAGLKYIADKLPGLIDSFVELAESGDLVVYCSRGGMRSQSISTLLELIKIRHRRLQGGYKAYRRYVIDYLDAYPQNQLVVLHGLTGVGKTQILKELSRNSVPVIDIEELANHRGSAFGNVGLGDQPSQKMFDSMLFNQLRKYQDSKYIIVECESRRTGKLNLPDRFFKAMKNGHHLLVYTTVQTRTKRIVAEYGPQIIDIAELKNSIVKLKKNLGRAKTEYLLTCLADNNIEQLVETLLASYYDPLYGYSSKPDRKFTSSFCSDNIVQAAHEIQVWCKENIH